MSSACSSSSEGLEVMFLEFFPCLPPPSDQKEGYERWIGLVKKQFYREV